jgi:hypothetical protein
MSNAAAIQATYSDLKVIRGRKVCQIVMEIPLEASEAFVAAFGMPNPAKETWVALALLDKKAVQHKDDGVQAPKNVRRAFHELTLAEQSAIKCGDRVFQRFLFEKHMMRDEDFEAGGQTAIDAAATAVRVACGVNSRSDILPNTPAGDKWRDVLRDFEGWKSI